MSKRMKQRICVVIATSFVMVASSSFASAQYPVIVNSVKPAVVGYTAEPAGLFGLNTRFRPIVAPVATPVAVTPVAVTPVAVTPVTVTPVAARPVTIVPPPPTPVVRYAAPPAVQTYYAPAPVVTPVTYVGI